jgi:hypothetical protein
MEQVRWPDVPPCYRFTPTARELIRYYLNPWVVSPGQTPFGEPEGVVCAADIYSADPGTLTSPLRPRRRQLVLPLRGPVEGRQRRHPDEPRRPRRRHVARLREAGRHPAPRVPHYKKSANF